VSRRDESTSVPRSIKQPAPQTVRSSSNWIHSSWSREISNLIWQDEAKCDVQQKCVMHWLSQTRKWQQHYHRLNYSLFWDVTQCCIGLTDPWKWNRCCPETSINNYQFTFLTSQKSEDLINVAAKSWRHAYYQRFCLDTFRKEHIQKTKEKKRKREKKKGITKQKWR